jgi:hypothetical protein
VAVPEAGCEGLAEGLGAGAFGEFEFDEQDIVITELIKIYRILFILIHPYISLKIQSIERMKSFSNKTSVKHRYRKGQ